MVRMFLQYIRFTEFPTDSAPAAESAPFYPYFFLQISALA